MKYEIHPAANLFPMMTKEEFEHLKKDIQEHGQGAWIVLYQGRILDGRNRYRACCELGIDPDFCEIDESDDFDPVQYVLTHNLHRRHLTTSQRAIIAGKLAAEKRGGDRKSDDFKAQKCATIEDAAKLLNVAPRTVDVAKRVIEHAAPEIVQAVERGELPVSFAAKVVSEESDKRTQAKLWKQGGKQALKEHITEPSPYVDAEADQGDTALRRFRRMWDTLEPVGQAAIRAWILDYASN